MERETAAPSRGTGRWYRIVSLLFVVLFGSPVSPVFVLLLPTGVFLLVLSRAVGTRVTGFLLVVIASVLLAPWKTGPFIIVYLGASSLTAVVLMGRWRDPDECSVYVLSAGTGWILATLYLILGNRSEFADYARILSDELSQASTEGLSTDLYSVFGADTGSVEAWLDTAIEAFVYLSPGLLTLVSIASLFLAATLLRGRPEGCDLLPEERSLSEFRFEDHLVWILIIGLVLSLVPFASWSRRVGGNTVLVMFLLVSVRGIGVGMAYLGRRIRAPLMKAGLLLFAFFLIPPLVIGVAFAAGLVDIWIDVRSYGQTKGAV